MTINELSKKHEEIKEKIRQRAKALSCYYELDGICKPEYYLNSKIKIMWILEEPYLEEDEDDCGGWSITEDLLGDDKMLTTWMHGKASTGIVRRARNMIRTSYGIMSNLKYDETKKYKVDEIKNVLREIAYINISKQAEKGTTNADLNKIALRYKEDWKEIVLEQIRVYNPEVIICGGTFPFIKDDFANDLASVSKYVLSTNFIQYAYEYKDTLIIDTYHPNFKGNRYVGGLSEKAYVDGIINAYCDWKKK